MTVTAAPASACAAMAAGAAAASQLSRSLERLLEEAALSGELRLSGRKLRELPRRARELADTVRADLSRNLLGELPEELTSYVYMERLLLAHNAIRQLPDAVSSLQSLTYLDLSGNELTEVPREVCSLPLEVLLVRDNRLECLPKELGRLTSLAELDAAHNRLAAVPLSIGDLTKLRALDLSDNMLALLPLQLTYLKLESLDVSSNCISSLPLELRHMTTLVTLCLDNNPLVSPPTTVCMRGRVHIFKYLESLENKEYTSVGGGAGAGRRHKHTSYMSTLSTPAAASASAAPAAHNTIDCLRYRARHLDHTDGDRRYSSNDVSSERGSGASTPNTPSTLSPGATLHSTHSTHSLDESPPTGQRVSPDVAASNGDDKSKHLGHQQTYRQYKEALRQQRQQDVYRPRSDLTPPSPDTSPIHHPNPRSPLNGHPRSPLLHSTPRRREPPDETRRPVQKVVPSRNIKLNGSAEHNGQAYSKPTSPTHESLTTTVTYVSTGAAKPPRLPWNKDVPPDKLSFTMKREFDKHKEESDLLAQLRSIIESRLKMSLPAELAPVLADGVVLCHLANHVRPRAVASVHVPSVAQPKLTMARCRRNVDNFLEACRKMGVEEEDVCSADDVLRAVEGGSLASLARTVRALAHTAPTATPAHTPLHVHTDCHRNYEERRECRIDYSERGLLRKREGCVIEETEESELCSYSKWSGNRVHPVAPAPRYTRATMQLQLENTAAPGPAGEREADSTLVTTLCLGGFLLTALLLYLFPLQ